MERCSPTLHLSCTPLFRSDFRAGLVGEERSERGDDGYQSGIHQVLNDLLDVFVSDRRFLVEPIASLTDDEATQWRPDQLRYAETLPYAETRLAAGPLASRTMGQRPGVLCAITERFHQVTERTA